MSVQTETRRTSSTPEPPREGVSRAVFFLSLAIAIAISGVAGLAIGWKVEQQRVKAEVVNIRPLGTITEVTDTSITVQLRTAKASRTYRLTPDTIIEDWTSGETSTLRKGLTVLVDSRTGPSGDLEATDVIIVPDSTTFG
ncbi:MAG: DUF5666 domain-containing protein [Microthrixaceae bacterium]